jgi:hypothetical protein
MQFDVGASLKKEGKSPYCVNSPNQKHHHRSILSSLAEVFLLVKLSFLSF